MTKKNNGKAETDMATAPTKRRVVLQQLDTVQLEADKPLDYYMDCVDCTGVREARKARRDGGEQGKFRIIEILDEFEVTHEQTTKEVITRSGQ